MKYQIEEINTWELVALEAALEWAMEAGKVNREYGGKQLLEKLRNAAQSQAVESAAA